MNGPQHYVEAERLIALAEATDWTTEVEPYRVPAIASAQVHATLALAAATAEAAPESPVYGPPVQRPLPKDGPFEGAPETHGSPWGQVLA